MKVEVNAMYENVYSKEKAYVTGILNDTVNYKILDFLGEGSFYSSKESFLNIYRLKDNFPVNVSAPPLVKTNKNKNINDDIINLIESGYEFKSFYGSTVDGKELHIELEV